MGEEKIESWEEMLENDQYFINHIEPKLWITLSEKIIRIAIRAKEQERDKWIKGFIWFAWWKNGVQYVGNHGTTLKQAIKMVDNNVCEL